MNRRSRALRDLEARIVQCRRCPRLVQWREEVAQQKRAAFSDQEYWGRPVPGFGDPERIAVVGLAPAATEPTGPAAYSAGTARVTGSTPSCSGPVWPAQPESRSSHDGLRLRSAWVTSPVKCAPPANKPTAAERDACEPFFLEELSILDSVPRRGRPRRVRPRPGGGLGMRPRPRFGHGSSTWLRMVVVLLGCYHVSQQGHLHGPPHRGDALRLGVRPGGQARRCRPRA
ncbi:MAG: uracil-DNA glycosylase [Microthrixaceae bacterium]